MTPFQKASPFSPAQREDIFPEGFPPGTVVQGTISTSKNATGYLKLVNDEGDVLADFIIPRDHLKRAFHGDSVTAVVADDLFYGRPYVKVQSVDQPGKRVFIGSLQQGPAGAFFFSSDDTKSYTDIFIPERLAKGASPGSKVQVELTEWRDKDKNPTGKVIEVFGKKGEHEAEMKAILTAKGIDYTFPTSVTDEADKIKRSEPEHFKDAERDDRRKDIREIDTFTIDPIDAKDFDDALSCTFNDDGTVTIGVHIADVSHYVTPGSALDDEARKREFSTYLVDRTIPMLPEVLSNDLCSLNPHTDKLAFTGTFVMREDGSVVSSWFGKTIIHSDRRFTYEEAQDILNSGNGDYSKELDTMNRIAKKLRDKRFAAGAIDFADTEIKFELDANGKPIRVYQKERFDAHKLVEEFMLLKNRLVAEKIEEIKESTSKTLPFMYRTHDTPDRERLEALIVFLEAVGYDIPSIINGKDITEPESINAIIKYAEGTPLEQLVSTEMLRSMAKAKYTVSNPRHFGLGFTHYCHFTSPIRRYPDLVAHRLLFRYLNGEGIHTGEWQQLEAIAQTASEREIEVMDAERESIKLKQVEYLTDRIGQTFTAIISGLSESGMFVEETQTRANGLIKFKTLSDDTYTLDRTQYAAIGASTGKKYQLGDTLSVRVLSTDLDLKQIDFEIVPPEQSN